jgi:hypothetical protein
MKATGTFEVKLTPATQDPAEAEVLGRRSIDKKFSGDLEATSLGVMLAAGTATKGSAGYVAIERVTGSLHGKSGTFVLQHFGIMNRGVGELTVRVVPDSGTDDLIGLAGTMTINIVDGKHLYELEYTP